MNLTLSIIYLISTVTFTFGLKFLGHQKKKKKGNLIEQGNHDDLIKANGKYASLWKKQTLSLE